MRKKKFVVRIFKCPQCGGKLYAPKKKTAATPNGHMKKMWCPYCGDEGNKEQIGTI